MLPGAGKPEFPLNILADFAGGGVMCAMGILLAVVERSKSGRGQVVNTDMVSSKSPVTPDTNMLKSCTGIRSTLLGKLSTSSGPATVSPFRAGQREWSP